MKSLAQESPYLNSLFRIVITAATTLAAGLLGAVVSDFDLTSFRASLSIIAIATVIGTLVGLAQRWRLWTDPLYISAVAVIALYFVRPLSDWSNGTFEWVNLDVSPYVNAAISIASVGISAFFLGNVIPFGRKLSTKISSPPNEHFMSTLLLLGYALLFIAISSRIIVALLRGGIHTLFIRREFLSGSVPAILGESIMFGVPAFMIFIYTFRCRKYLSLVGLLLAVSLFLLTGYTGDRRYLLQFVIAGATFVFLSIKWRPKLLPLALGSLVILVTVVAPVELTRGSSLSYTDAVVLTLSEPEEVFDRLFLKSQSTSMLNSFAIIVGEFSPFGSRDFRYGASTAAETVLQPIPQQLWQSKPEPIRTEIIQDRWGMDSGSCTSLCPTFSSFATLYSDGGRLWVFAGMLIVGVLYRLTSEFRHLYPSTFTGRGLYCSVLPSSLFVWWDSLGAVTLALLAMSVPIVIASRISGVKIQQTRPAP